MDTVKMKLLQPHEMKGWLHAQGDIVDVPVHKVNRLVELEIAVKHISHEDFESKPVVKPVEQAALKK